jgi:SAM-dependent methyltransferase
LGYEIQPFKSILADWSRIGLGISDDINLSVALHSKFFYSNSYYDAFPYLDIRSVPINAKDSFEFVTCSDVLEHIDTGINEAFQGLRSLIRPGGFVVASVPIDRHEGHSEFYVDLENFEIEPDRVQWVNSKGEQFIDDSPEFHGGRGQNLAFRQFSETSFDKSLISAGFSKLVKINFSTKLGVPELEYPGVVIARC